jgi:uncharacterized protein (DUF1800 family)
VPTSAADVHHLYRRAGFGASPAQVAGLVGYDRAQLVDQLLAADAPTPDIRPSFLDDPELGSYTKRVRLTWWWFDRMATTTRPFHEKMALFWHGHFVSGADKVSNIGHLYEQNRLFRASGRGSVRALTQAMAVQPAMLIYLDNKDNVVGRPNENFSRELMELFTLGVNQYSQDDVVASARAWTGHGMSNDAYLFRPERHDNGQKTFFGTTANWDGPGIIDHIFTGPKRATAARFIAGKLWAFLAYPNPEAHVLDAITSAFLAADLDVTALARAILLHDAFWSDTARNGLVRTPTEWMVAAMRATGLSAETIHPEWYASGMGQELFLPPNVSGWRPNAYWISPSAASAKLAMARNITWRAIVTPFLADTRNLPVETAIQAAFDAFHVDSPTPLTRGALQAWLIRQRQEPWTGWVEQRNLITLMLMTPDLQLA